MTLLDTSVLIEAFRPRGAVPAHVRAAIAGGERLAVCTLVLYEWRRGPRAAEEVAAQEAVFPASDAWSFGPAEAVLAADLYRRVPRPRQREIDLAIAACALTRKAKIWTLNPNDFADIPGLDLYRP